MNEIEMMRALDPSRGPFDPTVRDPIQERERNPRGTRHIDKTRQDSLPPSQRERVSNADRQREQRRRDK